MVKLSRYILVLIAVVSFSILIPAMYWTVFQQVPRVPSVFYSCILDDYVIITSDDGTVRQDTKGNRYTQAEYDSLLPLMFFRQLMADGRMPDTLLGVPMEPSSINRASSFYRYSPKKIYSPAPELYPMLESNSGRVQLAMPDDYFRINRRMEFIVASTNRIDEPKSEQFTAEMEENGFVFPAKIIAGIPSTRKSVDEGYFILDKENKLFHVKMVKGEPFVVAIETPENLDIVYIECVDIRSKEFYAYIFTETQGVYVLLDEVYEFQRLPLEGFNPLIHSFRINCDLFNKNITYSGDDFLKCVVVDDMYEVVNSYSTEWPGKYERNDGKVFTLLFPFEIKLNKSESGYINLLPDISPGFYWLLTNLILVSITMVIYRRRKYKHIQSIIDYIVVGITGIFGMIAVLIFPNKFKR